MRNVAFIFILFLAFARLAFSENACPSRIVTHEERVNTVGFLATSATLFCSGTLISPHVVLTAAHCVTKNRPSQVFFSTAAEWRGTPSPQYAPALEFRIHPNFTMRTAESDVALVALASKDYGFKP